MQDSQTQCDLNYIGICKMAKRYYHQAETDFKHWVASRKNTSNKNMQGREVKSANNKSRSNSSKAILLWWFLLFYVLVFKTFLCCWRLMYVIISLVKFR